MSMNNNFLEELLEKNGNFKPAIEPKTMADLSDVSRFTYQTVSAMVEFNSGQIGQAIFESMFILDNSGEGYLPVARIKQVLNMHGIKISLGQVMDLTDEASINEKGESNYLEIMSLLMGEVAIGGYVYRIAK